MDNKTSTCEYHRRHYPDGP